MKLVKAVFQVICAILFLLLVLACSGATTGLTTSDLCESLTKIATPENKILFWGSIILLQLAAMKWIDGLWNIVFSLLSIMLMAELVMIAGGLQPAVSTPLMTELQNIGATGIVKQYPAAYWLIPTLWMIACLCAREQARVFITAVICYLLWLLLTWLGAMGVSTWLSMGEPAPRRLADLLRENPWLTAAVPGFFLLVYAVLTALFETCLPRSKKQTAKEPEKKEQEEK